MKALLYGLGCTLLIGSAAAMAALPGVVTNLWLFLAGAAVLSSLNAAGWLTLSASAGDWPRPHAGPVLVLAGLVGGAYFLWARNWPGVAWNMIAILSGIPLWLAWRRSRSRQSRREPDPVRPPLDR